jgi:hypothetical protein
MDPRAGKAFLEAFHAWTDRPQIQPVVEYLKPFLPLHSYTNISEALKELVGP